MTPRKASILKSRHSISFHLSHLDEAIPRKGGYNASPSPRRCSGPHAGAQVPPACTTPGAGSGALHKASPRSSCAPLCASQPILASARVWAQPALVTQLGRMFAILPWC